MAWRNQKKGAKNKSMWLIVGTEAAELSRDRSERVIFVVPERIHGNETKQAQW